MRCLAFIVGDGGDGGEEREEEEEGGSGESVEAHLVSFIVGTCAKSFRSSSSSSPSCSLFFVPDKGDLLGLALLKD